MSLIEIAIVWILPSVLILGLGLVAVGLVVWRWW